MMRGTITPDLEAAMALTLVGPLGQSEEIEAVIDTGFTGELMLPRNVVPSLGLPARGGRLVILADGSLSRAESYEVTVSGTASDATSWRSALMVARSWACLCSADTS
jgi:predicted aspartyl protease